MIDDPESEDVPIDDESATLEHTLESVVDETTLAITGKQPAAPISIEAPLDGPPRSVPRPARERKPLPSSPPTAGPSSGPLGIPASPRLPLPPPSSRPPSVPPISPLVTPVSARPLPSSRNPLPPSPPLPRPPIAAIVPDDEPTRPGERDSARAVSNATAVDPKQGNGGDDVPLALPLAPASGPPGIPLLVTSGAVDRIDTKKKKGAGKRRRNDRKGKRRTVRIPDDHVPSANPSPPAIGAMRGTFDSGSDDALGGLDGYNERDSIPDDELEDASEELRDSDADVNSDRLSQNEETPTAPAAPASMPRMSAPGVLTDDQAIMVLRPIQVVSDLPPVPSAPIDEPEEPVPVSSQAEPIDDIEEIEPERMSLPGTIQHRPPPPPRSMQNPPVSPSPVSLQPASLQAPASLQPTSLQAGPVSVQPASPQPTATAASTHTTVPIAAIPGPLPIPPAPAPPQAPPPAPPPPPAAPPVEAKPEPRADTAKTRRPWWMELFEEEMVRTLDNPRQKDVERETTFIEQSLRLPHGSRVLDLGCGHGVHAVELASRGYQVVAVDLSSTMLALAKQYNDKRGQQVSLVQGDMRQLELDSVFDGIYCWSTSFGYFEDAVNVNVLERIARALKPTGRLVLDVANRDFVAPRSPSMAWFEKQGCVCMDEVRFDFFTSRLVAKRMVMFDNGRAREIEYTIRLYTAHELGRMLQQAGLKVAEVSGHRAHRGAFFGSESPRLIIVAERSP